MSSPGASLPVLLCLLLFAAVLEGQETVYSECWILDNLTLIGEHRVEVSGNPEVVDTELGRAVQFDGEGDRVLVDANPIGAAREFTVEVLFRPSGSFPDNRDPRFVHIQDPGDPAQKRVMIELRTTEENRCYLDGYLKTDNDNLALIDASLTHPSGIWHHAAVTYKDGVFTTYMNGEEELRGKVTHRETVLNALGKTSLGARMDLRNWFRGEIRMVKVTHAALGPAEFTLAPLALQGVRGKDSAE